MLRFMSPSIPSPEYVSETVPGAVYQLNDESVLVVGDVPLTLASSQPLISGELVIRYALTLLIPAGVVFVPGLFAAEKGGMLVGREAWDFIQSNFGLHPRADVLGIRLDGKTVQALIREIDFGVPVRVYIYSSAESTTPVTEVTRLIVGNNAPTLPDLLASYLPVTD
jgi:hypothetical protein